MRRLWVGVFVTAMLATDVLPASAAWNNVFQPTLFGCRRRAARVALPPAVAYYQPVVVQSQPVVAQAAPCGPQCSTSYSQRCYYQPVTTYETRSYYEQVTTQQTSYYYEPVTTYRQSCYFDPCTCSYRQVAIPQCSYELRARSCPVQTWVQRCAQVPVQSYQKVCYWQPQTTCCQTTYGAPIFNGGAAPLGTAQPPLINGNPAVPPIIDQNRSPTGSPTDVYRQPIMPGASWQPAPVQPSTFPTNNAPPPPPVKLDRIVVGPDANVEGQILRSDNAPRANAQVLFVSANSAADRQTTTANSAGRFQVSLASGGWLVYLQNPDGTSQYHSRIEVNGNGNQPARVTVVN